MPPYVNWTNRVTREFRDCVPPKAESHDIRFHHPNLPLAGELLPDLMRHLSPESASSISAKNKELSHIPDGRISGDLRSSLHENQSCQVAIDSDQKWMPIGFAPIEGQTVIAEPAIRSDLDMAQLTEIVHI